MKMTLNNKILKALALVSSVVCLSTSYGAIISVSGSGVQISAPSSTAAGATEANQQQGFDEIQGFQLLSNLVTDGGIISAGTWVSSHMIFLDTVGSANKTKSAIWTFDGNILGLLTNSNEFNSSSFLGAVGTFYPSSLSSRGWESSDSYSVSGNEFSATMKVTSPGDWVRVVTAYSPETNSVPDAGSTGAMFLGSILLAVAFRKRLAK